MTAITFDTLRFANRLKAAGVPPAQAEAEAEALAEVFEANLDQLVTRQDLRETETKLIGETIDLRKDMEMRFTEAKGETILLKWMLGLLIAGVASLVLKTFF